MRMHGRRTVNEELTQFEQEELSAYFDAQLDQARADEIRQLIHTDNTWKRAYEQMTEVDGLLDLVDVPSVPADLAERIVADVRSRERGLLIHLRRLARPLAAAAAIALVVIVGWQIEQARRGAGVEVAKPIVTESPVIAELKDLPKEDQFAVQNLDFVRDYDVLENFETIQAIEKLEDGNG